MYKVELLPFGNSFYKDFFEGASDFSWRAVACTLLQNYRGFGLDKHLFLLDPLKLDLSKMSSFYRNLLNCGVCFIFKGLKAHVLSIGFWRSL